MNHLVKTRRKMLETPIQLNEILYLIWTGESGGANSVLCAFCRQKINIGDYSIRTLIIHDSTGNPDETPITCLSCAKIPYSLRVAIWSRMSKEESFETCLKDMNEIIEVNELLKIDKE